MSWVTRVEECPMSRDRSSIGMRASCSAQVANTCRRLWNVHCQFRPSLGPADCSGGGVPDLASVIRPTHPPALRGREVELAELELVEPALTNSAEVDAARCLDREHRDAPAPALWQASGGGFAGFDDLPVEADPPPVGIDLVQGERHVFTPAHPAVGDEQDLQLPPPHPRPRRACGGELMDSNHGGDLVLGDRPVNRLVSTWSRLATEHRGGGHGRPSHSPPRAQPPSRR